ncbi:MAG: protein kinase [Candidatus Hydrogenedentes bacterium]|nr:protein kinase [Candidatus Hydrogenedentota bacterium]
MERDRNLLFGVFAVQLGKVTPGRLMEAAGAWAIAPATNLPDRLVEAKALDPRDRELIQRLVDEAVAAHGGDASQTLASFGGESQVHQSYRGSILLTADGQVSIPPTAGAPTEPDPGVERFTATSSIKGVFEAPGRYTSISEHARGGMGRVLLVHDDFLGRDIALKELLPHLGERVDSTPNAGESTSSDVEHLSPVRFSAHILARFLQEARITGQLEHPSIVPVYELGHRSDGSLYYTMKLVRGRSLAKAIGECRGLEERLRLLPHFVDLCQAIAYAHSRRVIHRDIKPANIMVGEFGETVVLDWGLAKKRDREDVHQHELAETLHAMKLGEEAAAAKTAYGQILGTPVYMPPEQAKGDLDEVDEQSDVYSLGVVLYEILTGRIPFEGRSTRDVLKQVIAGEWAPISSHEKLAPPELVAIAAKAMRRDKAGRYPNANALAEEVQRFQSGALVQAHRYNLADYTRVVWRRYKPLIATGALAFAAIAMVIAGYTYRLAESRDREAAERKKAEVARQTAETARQTAEIARAEAVAAKEKESTALQNAERNLYHASVLLAQVQIDNHNVVSARKQLLAAPADLRGWEWGYLYQCLDASKLTLAGHSAPVESAEFSPDGRRIVTVSRDRTAKVWDAESGKELSTLSGHSDRVWSAHFSPDGPRIVMASFDSTAKVLWDAESRKELITLAGHSDGVRWAAFSPDGRRIVTASYDSTAKMWDAESGEELTTLAGHSDEVYSAEFSPDGHRILTASWDRTAKVWDAESGKELATLAGHSDGVRWAEFSPDGRRIVTASDDRTARVWDAESGKELVALAGHSDGVRWAEFSPDGRRIVTASSDRTAKVWEAESGQQLVTLAAVSSAHFSPDGRRIVTASYDGTAKVWEAESGKELATLAGHSAPVESAAFSPDGHRIVTASQDVTAKVWDAESDEDVVPLARHSEEVLSADFSPNGSRIVTASRDYTAKVWDAESGEELTTLAGHLGGVLSAAFSPDGRRIVTASFDRTAKVWDAESGEDVVTLAGHSESVSSAAFSPDGRWIVTASHDDTAKVWDAVSGKELATLAGHSDWVSSAAFSPDGRRIVTASHDYTATVWDVVSGKELTTLDGHAYVLWSAAFSPDGRRIVTASGDGTAKVWDAESGKELATLAGHSAELYSAAFSPDGRRIVTASQDSTAKVWDAESGKELTTLAGHTHVLWSAKFSPDGRRIVTASGDGTAKVWDAAPWRIEQRRLISKSQALQLFGMGADYIQSEINRLHSVGDDVDVEQTLLVGEVMAPPLDLLPNDQLVSLNDSPIKGYPSLLSALDSAREAIAAGTLTEMDLVVDREDARRITVQFIVEDP